MSRVRRASAVLLGTGVMLLPALLAGCASPGSAGDPKPLGNSATSTSTPQTCPNAHGGACLGTLDGTSHTTTVFQPAITYKVPAGWANYEDLPGNFLLVPPGGDLDGVDAGTSDYIGVFTSIKPSNGCSGGGEGAATPAEIAAWIGKQQELAATAPKPVTVGGLHGLVMDIRLSPDPNGHHHVPAARGQARGSHNQRRRDVLTRPRGAQWNDHAVVPARTRSGHIGHRGRRY